MTESVKFRVSEAIQRDVGRKIARISHSVMNKLGINTGDYLEIVGPSGSALVQAMPAFNNISDDEIKIDGYVRKTIGVSVGDEVEVRRAKVDKATKIVLAPEQPIRFDQSFVDYVKDHLMYKPVTRGETIPIPVYTGTINLTVVSTQPSNYVYVSSETQVEILNEPAKTVEEIELREDLEVEFVKKLLSTKNGKEFEELVAPLLRLVGINNVYVWRKQRGEPDGVFYIKNLAVIYDATLESNFEISKKQQIENYVNMLREPSIEVPKGGVKKKVILGDKDKEIWIITRGRTSLIEDIEGIKVKEVSVNDLIQIYKERLSGLMDEDELVERLKSLGKRRGNSE